MQTDVAAFVISNEPMWADGAAFDVTGKITNGGVTAPDVLKLHAWSTLVKPDWPPPFFVAITSRKVAALCLRMVS